MSSPEQPRSPSPIRSPPIRPKSSKQPISSARTEYSQRHASYLRRPKSKPRTPSPVPVSTIRRSPSPSNRPRSKPVKHHSPTPLPKQEEPKGNYYFYCDIHSQLLIFFYRNWC